MPQSLLRHGQRQRSTADDLTRRWAGGIGLTAAVGSVYFLAGLLGIGLLMPPEGIAVFWPAAGISSGVLIALGPVARWPVAVGAMGATIVANLLAKADIWTTCAFVLGNTAEPLIIAGLIEYYLGARFSLDRLRPVLGLLAAAVAGPTIAGIGWTVVYRLFHTSTVPILTTWQHWFGSDITGVVTVAPLVIGLASAVRQPPPRSELMKGTAALVALAVMTGIIIVSLPQEVWETVMPVAWLFPILLWLAARCRPIFAAAGAFMVSLTVVSTTIFGIGHFGNIGLPIGERVLQAQASILVVAIFTLILAALFAERRANEARLAHSNMMLERERDNKLANVQAVMASTAHEVKQPLAAIVTNGGAALRFLGHEPPDLEEVRSALNRIVSDAHRTSQILDDIRVLFASTDSGQEPVDVNETALEVLRLLQEALNDHGVTARLELASDLPLVMGHRGQLQEVIINLLQNAIEAMNAIEDGRRMLQVRTERHGDDSIVVEVENSGPAINPEKLEKIFDAFVTTKSRGMGLGLAICRMIVERHGGQLTASSDGKSGALFQFILPIESADKAEIHIE